ncbi:MAG: hypothetical protein JXR68_06130 [Bacteroidales bacterium]|nr:hypothetical protein [Bacteroidales bacterium]
MKKIIFKLFLFLAISFFVFLSYLLIFANGKADSYYLRFTTKKQSSLILGSSRAAQGIIPSVFNNSNFYFSKNIYNFSFTVNDSRYGKIYLDAIKKKIDTTQTNGLFILEVNPLSISTGLQNIDDNPDFFRENNNFLHCLKNMSSNPNFEYLYKFMPSPYARMVIYNILSKFEIKSDGWLEISIPMDSATCEFRKKIKFNKYLDYFSSNMFSQNRLNSLDVTIKYLMKYGKVVLVRLPVDTIMLKMEDTYMPTFNEKMIDISKINNVQYLDLTPMSKDVLTTDGNHLWKESAKLVSNVIKYKLEYN